MNKIEEATITSANFMTGFGPAPGGGFNMPLEAALNIRKSKKKKKDNSFLDKLIEINLDNSNHFF